jgi:hypothetical protein
LLTTLVLCASCQCCARAMIAPEGGEPPPVPKSVGWFLGAIHDLNAAGQSTFLASASSTVDRIMPCCQTLAVDSNGTLSMPYGLPINGTLYQGKEILVNLGGKADSVPAMWARKEAFAQEVLALAVKMEISGFTMDWEFVRDNTHAVYISVGCTLSILVMCRAT